MIERLALVVLRDAPMVGVNPLDDARRAQRLEPTNMGRISNGGEGDRHTG